MSAAPNPAPAPAPTATITQAALESAVQAAVAAALAANAPAAPSTTFAKSPARAFNDVVDFTTKAGAEVYARAVESLPTKFTFTEPNIPVLIDELTTRTANAAWAHLFDIPVQNGSKNLLTQYGQLTWKECHDHVATYIHNQTRQAQNNYLLFECLRNTLDSSSKDKLAQESSKYLHGTEYDGVSYLYSILSKAEASSRATASAIRKQLSKLPEYMKDTAQDNVSAFNQHVRKQNNRLVGLGQESTDLIDHMLEAYRTIRDEEFKTFISHVKNEYEMGRRNLTLDELVEETESKYNILVTRGEWKERTSEQEEIIALRAQVDSLRKRNNSSGTKQKDNKKTSKKKKGGNDKTGKKGTAKYTGKSAWRNEAPKSGELTTKTRDGKQWHYCRHHKWNLTHLSKDCKVLQAKSSGDKKEEEKPTADPISAAMASVGVEDVEDDHQE